MSFPSTDPKFNAAFYHWADASHTRYNFNLFERDTLADILSHCSRSDLRQLAILLGIPQGRNKTHTILNLVEELKSDTIRHFRGKVSLSIIPVSVD